MCSTPDPYIQDNGLCFDASPLSHSTMASRAGLEHNVPCELSVARDTIAFVTRK